MADESPELIEQEMAATRASLTNKVAALESTVIGTLQQAATAVQETVQTVKSAVTDTTATVKTALSDTSSTVKDTLKGSVDTVSEGVKEMFDVKTHVRDNPAAALGLAAAAGFVTGLLVFRKEQPAVPAVSTAHGFASTAYTPAPPAAAPATARRPGWVDDLFEMFGEEAKKIGTQALTTLAAAIRQNIDTEVPHLVQNVMHKVTAGTGTTPGAGYPRANGHGTGV
jgi:ElaB/YqjD/DUF883 family membrane-anchored ribosome-binding protein